MKTFASRLTHLAAALKFFVLISVFVASFSIHADSPPVPRWYDLNTEPSAAEQIKGSNFFQHQGFVYFNRADDLWCFEPINKRMQQLVPGELFRKSLTMGTDTYFLLKDGSSWQLWLLGDGEQVPGSVDVFATHSSFQHVTDLAVYNDMLVVSGRKSDGRAQMLVYEPGTGDISEVDFPSGWNTEFLAELNGELFVSYWTWDSGASSLSIASLDVSSNQLRFEVQLSNSVGENTYPLYVFDNLLMMNTDTVGNLTYSPETQTLLPVTDKYPRLLELADTDFMWGLPRFETNTHLYFLREYRHSNGNLEPGIWSVDKSTGNAEFVTPFTGQFAGHEISGGEWFVLQRLTLEKAGDPYAFELQKFLPEQGVLRRIGFTASEGNWLGLDLSNGEAGLFYAGTSDYVGDWDYSVPVDHQIWTVANGEQISAPIVFTDESNYGSEPRAFAHWGNELLFAVNAASHLEEDQTGGMWKLSTLNTESNLVSTLLSTVSIPAGLTEMLARQREVQENRVLGNTLYTLTFDGEEQLYKVWAVDLMERTLSLATEFNSELVSSPRRLFVFAERLFVLRSDRSFQNIITKLDDGGLTAIAPEGAGRNGLSFEGDQLVVIQDSGSGSQSIITIDYRTGSVEKRYDINKPQFSFFGRIQPLNLGYGFIGWDGELSVCNAYYLDDELSELRVMAEISTNFYDCRDNIRSVIAAGNSLYLTLDSELLKVPLRDTDAMLAAPVTVFDSAAASNAADQGLVIFNDHLYFAGSTYPHLKRLNLTNDQVSPWMPDLNIGDNQFRLSDAAFYLSSDVLFTDAFISAAGSNLGKELVAVDLNRAPEIVVDSEIRINAGESLLVDAGETSDLDGDTLAFEWTLVAGDSVTLENTDQPVVTINAADVNLDSQVQMQLRVSDEWRSSLKTISIYVLAVSPPSPPAPSPQPQINEASGGSFSIWLLALLLVVSFARVRNLRYLEAPSSL